MHAFKYIIKALTAALRACVCEPGPGTPTELLRRGAEGAEEQQLQREGHDDDEGGGGGHSAAARSRRVHGGRLARSLWCSALDEDARVCMISSSGISGG